MRSSELSLKLKSMPPPGFLLDFIVVIGSVTDNCLKESENVLRGICNIVINTVIKSKRLCAVRQDI